MSRSYRKYPRVKCERSCKFGKNQANRRIRRIPVDVDIPQHRQFKKLYQSCDICDYAFTEFKDWVITKWNSAQKDKANGVRNHTHWATEETLDEELALWKKYYFYK